MTNLYPARIAELHDFLEDRYGQKDRQATEILLACLLEQKTRPWVILETDYPTRDMRYAWFAFGGVHPNVWSLAVPRVERKKTCEEILYGWLEGRKTNRPATYVESEWRRLPPDLGEHARAPMASGWRTIMSNEYRLLMSSCVRVRVEQPRGMSAVMDRDADRNELARLTSRVLDSSLGRAANADSSSLVKSMFYWCELGQRLMPFMIDWDTLVGSLAAIARGISLLYNDGRGPSWRASERVLRDSIPWATAWILGETDHGIKEGRKRLASFQAAGHTMDKAFKGEMRRLNRLGVILSRRGYGIANFVYHPWRYRLASQDWKDLIDRGKEIFR